MTSCAGRGRIQKRRRDQQPNGNGGVVRRSAAIAIDLTLWHPGLHSEAVDCRLRDIDAGERVSSLWTSADCDGVSTGSQRRERYRQYGAEGPQGEHGRSQRVSSWTLFDSMKWSRRLEIHTRACMNRSGETRIHQVRRRSDQSYYDFRAITLVNEIR